MALQNAYSQYKENSIYTSRPEDLTLMLYNGLVKFIMQGISYIDKNDIENANIVLQKAQAILMEFQKTLDKKYEISHSLDMLYDYMLNRLVEANTLKKTEILNEVLTFARELRDTWSMAMKISRNKSVSMNSDLLDVID